MTEDNQQQAQQSTPPINLPQWLIIGGVLAFSYIFFMVGRQIYKPGEGLKIFNLEQSAQQEQQALQNQEKKQYTFEADEAGQTPLSLLEDKIDVGYQEYDFGVFVESIDGQKASDDYFWALYVNDELAQKAADKIELEPGDKVEWLWEEVQQNFE